MTELLTAAQMRAIETAAIESGEVTGLELMECAGRGVVEAIFEEWPELAATSHRAVVLCGPGNNGGDGFVVARLLKEWGWDVEVFLYGDPGKLPPDARVNYERWRKIGDVREACDEAMRDAIDTLGAEDLVLDAFFGTGFSRAFDRFGKTQVLLNDMAMDRSATKGWARVVAIDVPSGFCADSGRYLTEDERNAYAFAPFADLTVAFHRAKCGHHLGLCAEASGRLVVASIGLDRFGDLARSALVGLHDLPENGQGLGRHVVHVDCERPDIRKGAGHKYAHGHALILTGGAGKTGAARLAARGALRIGAGLVTLGVPGSAQLEVASQVTAIMLKRAGTADEVAAALEDARINALCLGPGLGVARARELVPVACGGVKPRPTVLDADALSAFADAPEALFAMLHENCILTPHGGEFARLFPDVSERLCEEPSSGPAYSKVDATREAAKRAGCVVLFKGPDTVIAAPDGRCSINSAQYERAAPWLATAGSGDVLAGFITGLLARGLGPMQAAETAAWLHVECARSFGPGLIAEDLPEELPKVFRQLGV